MINTYKKGVWAERFSMLFLLFKGFEILCWRYKTKMGEIDIIAKRGRLLIFCEVKFRKKTQREILTSKSLKRMENAARIYLAQNPNYAEFDVRFDLITIKSPFSIHHLDNIYQTRAY